MEDDFLPDEEVDGEAEGANVDQLYLTNSWMVSPSRYSRPLILSKSFIPEISYSPSLNARNWSSTDVLLNASTSLCFENQQKKNVTGDRNVKGC